MLDLLVRKGLSEKTIEQRNEGSRTAHLVSTSWMCIKAEQQCQDWETLVCMKARELVQKEDGTEGGNMKSRKSGGGQSTRAPEAVMGTSTIRKFEQGPAQWRSG